MCIFQRGSATFKLPPRFNVGVDVFSNHVQYNVIITKFEGLLNRSGVEGVGASSARISRLQP